MESVSQLVLTMERLEGNPHLSPVVNGNGRLIKLFPAKFYCDIQKKFTWGVIISKELHSVLFRNFLVFGENWITCHLVRDVSSTGDGTDEGRLGKIEEGEGRLWLGRREELLEGRRENNQINKKIEIRYFRNREVSVIQKTDPYNSVTINTKNFSLYMYI